MFRSAALLAALLVCAGCSGPPPLESQLGLMRHGEHSALGLWLDPPEAWQTTNTAAPEVLFWVADPPAEGRALRVQTRGANTWRVFWGGMPGYALDLDVERAAWKERVRLDVIHGQLVEMGTPSAAPDVLETQRRRRQLGPLADGGVGPGNLPRMLTIRLNADGSYDYASQPGVAVELLGR